MVKVTFWILFLGGGSYVLFCALLYFKQRSMLYFPTRAVSSPHAEVIWLEHEGEKLKVWEVKRDTNKALIYFGGNAEDVALNLPTFKSMFRDYSLFLLNYRGYGGSSGSPSEAALFSDAKLLGAHVEQHYESVMVMGRSLGTGVAAYLASQMSIDRLILVTPFASMTGLASSHYPLVPVAPLLKDRYESATYLKGVEVPILVLIAEHDEIIPRRQANALVAGLNEKTTEKIIIPDTGHNSIEMNPLYAESLARFSDSD